MLTESDKKEIQELRRAINKLHTGCAKLEKRLIAAEARARAANALANANAQLIATLKRKLSSRKQP